MSEGKKNTGAVPLPPRYIMLNKSEPPYDMILKQLQTTKSPVIGQSYYYIRAGYEWRCLCRITPSSGSVLFHEILDPGQNGISDEDIHEAIEQDKRFFTLPGFYCISVEIEKKLKSAGVK
ncbi:hypothetical protein [uncultured Methanoregula sp.]|uniref:hypothetical protein n=1 Tax=uncultured Methanoregula sp. TaxID=1005933 RepID=UPI002AAADF1B|nr:hypothetical protein [uncultured Methanoregula sp.]